MADGLFEISEPPAPEQLSADQKRIRRQAEALAAGVHPLALALPTGRTLGVHAQAAPADDRQAAGRRCGGCLWRTLVGGHARDYPKCGRPGAPRSGGTATDVRAWWPACTEHIPITGPRWVVQVNEVLLNSIRGQTGADWWLHYSDRPGLAARTLLLCLAVPGRLIYLACTDKQEAEFLRSHMVDHSCHPTTVKVRRIGHLITCAGCAKRRPFWATHKRGGSRCQPCYESWLNRPIGGVDV